MVDPNMTVPTKYVEVPVVIRFGDTDPYGVVYFASYFRYCHHGIEELLRQVGLAPHNVLRNPEEGYGLPVVGAACDFLKPVWYGETLRLRVSIVNARSKSVTFGFHFYKEARDEIVAKGQATIVTIDRQWRSRLLPDRVKESITPYMPPEHGS
ncbi:MAG: acyl-CoA thioesterase [Syntrophobacteraceae bacterium]